MFKKVKDLFITKPDEALEKQLFYEVKNAFNENDKFMNFYKDKIYQKENSLVGMIDKTLVASFNFLPYFGLLLGHKLRLSYIYAAQTLQKHQGRGIMRQMMEDGLKRMYHEGFELCVLVPANRGLFHFYSKFSFINAFELFTKTLLKTKTTNTEEFSLSYGTDEKVSQLYHVWLKSKENVDLLVVQTEADLDKMIKFYAMSGRRVLTLKKDDKIIGIAFVSGISPKIRIQEISVIKNEYKEPFLNLISVKYNSRPIFLISDEYSDGCCLRPYGMMRIINLKKILSVLASFKPKLTILIQVTDDLIEENNGFWQIKHGKVLHLEKPLSKLYYVFTIKELSSSIFTNRSPFQTQLKDFKTYMNLMLH